jgi:prepilin signal peptidase PulO-like enzyme (type II secretory pathway)
VSFIISIPLNVRLGLVFLLGTLLGSLANWGIYRLAWNPRAISPWILPDPSAPRRRFWDRIPVLGWLGLRREANLYGAGFWIRPMVLELCTGFGFAALYWWEMSGGLLPIELRNQLHPVAWPILHAQFAAHLLLITWMLTASFIDFDEMIIPDTITVSGTLIGLLMAAAWPQSLLPNFYQFVQPGEVPGVRFLHLASPDAWPEMLSGGIPFYESLALGLACWWLWCVAIMTRTWYSRHGWRRALQLSLARLVRDPSTYRILKMAMMGTLAITLVWYRGGPDWQGLLSALVGMAIGGGLIWSVRIVGRVALGREAMGFGDVTLMAMLGTFLGWQSMLLVFFLAPIAGLLIGVIRLILFRDREMPYGPFLCLASLVLIVCWDQIWHGTVSIFDLGWIILMVMVFCLLLMGVMLGIWRLTLSLCSKK